MLDGNRVISGSFGEIWENGEFQEHVNEMTSEVTINKAALNLAGGKWTKHKRLNISGAGTMSGYRVTSGMLQQHIGWLNDDTAEPITSELIQYLKDPEAWGHEAVRLENVKYDTIPVAGFTAGSEVTFSTAFTFEGIELINPIVKP